MKRIISAALSAAILLSLSGISALAAIPAAPAPVGSQSPIISEDYTDNKATFFNNKKNDGSFEISDGAVTIKMPEYNTTDVFSGATYAGVQLGTNYTERDFTNRPLGSGQVLPEDWMVEFDAKAVDNSTSLNIVTRTVSQNRIFISPDVFTVGTWYTFRVYAHDDFSSEANRKAALANSVAIYMIERDNQSAVGKWLVSGKDFKVDDSGLSRQPCNYVFAFGMCANAGDKTWLKAGASTETMAVKKSATATENISVAALNAEYQLDNITIYSQPALQDEYELYEGLIHDDGFEASTNNGAPVEVIRENADNEVLKVTVSYNESTGKANNGTEIVASVTDSEGLMNDGFVVDVDLCNTVPGFGMMLSIAGAQTDILKPNSSNYYVNGKMLTIRSHDDDLNKWFTYRIVCTPNKETTPGYMDVAVYRRLANTNAPFVLTDAAIYETKGPCGDSGAQNAYKIKTGYYGTNDLKYYTDAIDNAKAVWLMDNLQVFDKAAYSGNVTSDATSVTAELNVATATNGSTAIVAVYEGTKLVDVNYANVSSVGGKVRVKCDTAPTDKTVKLYIWDGLGTAKPLLDEAKTLNTFLN